MDAQLGVILELTDRVQNAIDAGDWQGAHELEIERRALLERLVAEHVANGGLGTVFTELEQRNHRLIGLVRHHQRTVLREAATAKSAHTAASAYAESARGG